MRAVRFHRRDAIVRGLVHDSSCLEGIIIIQQVNSIVLSVDLRLALSCNSGKRWSRDLPNATWFHAAFRLTYFGHRRQFLVGRLLLVEVLPQEGDAIVAPELAGPRNQRAVRVIS